MEAFARRLGKGHEADPAQAPRCRTGLAAYPSGWSGPTPQGQTPIARSPLRPRRNHLFKYTSWDRVSVTLATCQKNMRQRLLY